MWNVEIHEFSQNLILGKLSENKVYTSLQGQQEIQTDILKKKSSNKAWLISTALNMVFDLDGQ